MVELVFVIVMLGILAAIAVPRLAASREDACLVKLRSDIAAIKSEINLKNSKDFLLGKSAVLSEAQAKQILGIPNSNAKCKWSGGGASYTASDGKNSVVFTLSANGFTCDEKNNFCVKLIK